MLVRVQLHGVEFVIQKAALAAAEVRVEVIRLQAVHDGSGFAHRAVFETDDRRAAGVVFVRLEDVAAALRGEGADALDFAAHHHEERVERVATGGEQGAAAVFLASVPAELAIPRPDAVIVVDFSVVQLAEQTFVDQRLRDGELVRKAALKAHAALHAVRLGGGGDLAHFLQAVRHRFFENDVLLRVRGGHGLVAVLARVAGDVHHVDVRVFEHLIEARVALHRAAEFGAELGVIEFAGRKDRGDLALRGFVDRFDVGGGRPAVSDDADVVFFHGGERREP